MYLKSETLRFLAQHNKVLRAADVIRLGVEVDGLPAPHLIVAPGGPTREFFDSLDFEYDNGYGGQEIEGTLWFADGTWATRGEYDGSEWWELHQCPPLPAYLA